ncbi:SGNH/GDSL hydrolase family protein [Butyrivibrio sp. XPD2006]|uniref:SGNH/GDSL hydrolase family protein n=1 Tax=Butyrivibrio sp. XPD2006 TaxID=1280668 RepID=UPI0003B4C2F6|nr:SGNH/GDSL hydrolase family protein [Butyrivibrio sp. XPD2006]
MKKNTKILLSSIMTLSLFLSGCSLNKDNLLEPTEYLSDTPTEVSLENNDAAADGQSIVVVENLFEPILDALENDTAKDNPSAEASQEESKPEENTAEENTEPVDKVNIVFFGDSQIANGRDDGSDIPTIMSTRIPNSVVYNFAIGGSTATLESSTSSYDPATTHSTNFLGLVNAFAGIADRNETLSELPGMLNNMNSIAPADVDYYFIEYGANDFFNNMGLDCDAYQTRDVQAHYFYNALNMGINTLKEISPNATFVLMTPFYGIYVADDGTYIGDSYIVSNGVGTLSDYAKKVGNVSEDQGTWLFDGMFMTKHDLYLDTAGEYLMDNLHLTLKGRQIMARLLAHIVNFQEQNEPYCYLDTDKIKIAEFDPNEYYRYDEGQMKEYYPESWEKYIKGVFPLAQPSQEALDAYNAEQNGG